MGYHFQRPDEAAMERLLSHHFSSPERAILRLAWLQGLSRAEITSLTWNQVDFQNNLLRLSDRELPMGSRLRRMLWETWEHRKDPAEPRVFTAPTTGRPMDLARLTTVTRTARQQLLRLRETGKLVRVGTRYYPAGAVVPPEEHLTAIRAYLLKHGTGRRRDFLELLHVSPEQGTQILFRLVKQGALPLTGRCYRLPDKES